MTQGTRFEQCLVSSTKLTGCVPSSLGCGGSRWFVCVTSLGTNGTASGLKMSFLDVFKGELDDGRLELDDEGCLGVAITVIPLGMGWAVNTELYVLESESYLRKGPKNNTLVKLTERDLIVFECCILLSMITIKAVIFFFRDKIIIRVAVSYQQAHKFD